jgi:SAM-dependent methyltransferase
LKGQKIPGSTRVPAQEIIETYGSKGLNNKKFLDAGSGSGRSTQVLKNIGIGDVVALDLSFEGLALTGSTPHKLNASAEFLPLADNSFDGINLCGVMTNLTDRDFAVSQQLRQDVAKELYRCLKPGGRLFVSDFCAEHFLTDYPVDYRKHALITGESGTIAVFDPDAKISFRGLSDDDIRTLGQDSIKLVRFAHHYLPNELSAIFKNAGFDIESYKIERGETPSGKPIENIIVVAMAKK